MARQNKITPKQLLEVLEARKINTDPQIDRWLHALQLCGEGELTNIEIAEKLNTTPFAICRWLSRASKQGIQSFLKDKDDKQTPLGITSEQRLDIINALKKSRNHNTDKRLLVILLSSEGMRVAEVAEKFNISQSSVNLWISKFKTHGVQPLTINNSETRPFQITPSQCLEIIAARKKNTNPQIDRYLYAILLRSGGMSNAKIAQKFKVSLPCVYKWMDKFKEFGIQPYSISQPKPSPITEEQRLEIIEARRKNTDPKTDKQLYALLLRAEGLSHTKIEEKLGLKPQSVAHLQRKLIKRGVQALLCKYRKPKSRKRYSRNMTIAEEFEWLQQFKDKLESGQIKISEIKAAYEKKVGKESKSRGHIYCILKRHGLYKTTTTRRKRR